MKFSEIQEACWSGYQQQGMKKKGDRMVPNCVPVEEVKVGPEISMNELLYTAAAKAMRDAGREGIDLDYEDAIRQASQIYGIPYKPSQLPKLQAQLKALDARIAPLKQQLDLKKQQRKQQKYGVAPNVAQPQVSVTPATGRIKPPAKTLEEYTGDPFIDNAARELLGFVLMVGVPFAVGVYIDIRNKLRKYQGKEIIDALERKGVTMNRQTYEKVKPVLDRFDQAIRDDDGAEAKSLAKQIEQMIIMGKLSAPEPRTADSALAAKEKELSEDLKKWFKEKWVRFGPDGKIRGACARDSESEGKPKCLPQSKAHALGKKGRASAAAKKRREDPNPERRGPARNVATKVKEVKDINAVRDLIKQSGASNAFQQADNKRKQAEALLDQLKDLQNKRQQLAIKRIKPSQEYYQELDRIVTAISELGYEAQGPTNGQYTLRAKFKEQRTNDDDWYDDADEFGMPGSEFFSDDDRLRDGDYVRDRQDGEHGEIFRMSGDPTERRVRILDRDGKGWYISPERLVAVDRSDPDIMKYFGKRRHRDMDESAVAEGFEYGSRVQHPKYGAGQVIKVYSNGVITVNFPNYPDPIDKKPGVQSNFAPGDNGYQSLKPIAEAEAKTMYRVIFNGRPIDVLIDTMQQAQMIAKKLEQKYGGKVRIDHTVDVPKTLDEKQDACYRKVKSRYKVWPSAYASGALVQCRKKGAANWGNKKK